MAFLQYLKDTRGELHHVAWPTRVQTIIFTMLVIAISILVSLYLGFFDFLFTTGLGEVVEHLPGVQNSAIENQPLQEPLISTSTADMIISTTSEQ